MPIEETESDRINVVIPCEIDLVLSTLSKISVPLAFCKPDTEVIDAALVLPVPATDGELLIAIFDLVNLSESVDSIGAACGLSDATSEGNGFVGEDVVGEVVGNETIGTDERFPIIETIDVTLFSPPAPEAPRSLLTIVRLARPLKLAAGLNCKPLRAELISAVAPEKVIMALAAPGPMLKLSPVVFTIVIVPLVTDKVTCKELASISETVIELPFAAEKMS